MQRSILAPLVLVVVFSGCSDNPVTTRTEAETPASWQRHALPSGIAGEAAVLDLEARDADLFVLGRRFFAALDATGELGEAWSLLIPSGLSLPFTSNTYFVYPLDGRGLYPSSISINWSVEGRGVPTEVQLPLTLLDPALSERAGYSAHGTPVAVINDEGRMLLSVHDSRLGDESRAYLYLVRLRPRAPGDFSEIHVAVERRIERPLRERVMTTGSRFFLSSVRALYELKQSGDMRMLRDDGAWSVIEHDGQLFVYNWNGIFVSVDDGATWRRIGPGDGKGEFFVVDGRLCILRSNSILLIDAVKGSATHLVDDGLPQDGHDWSVAVQFGNRVYVATHAGLYSKPVSEFF